MTRRIATSAILAALLLSGLLPSAVAADPVVPLPATMAAVGDSSTQAASTGGTLGADAPQNSWSTGTSGTVNSHYLRLLALSAPINGANHNRSVSGAKMAGLNAQMENVGGLQPDYLTVLIGGADLCTGTVAEMTSVTDFRAQFLTAMTTLTAGSPDTDVYLVSIPDAYQLWNLFKGDFLARFIWSAGNICQSLLANPTSTQAVDVQRRAAVRQRNIDYNTQLAEVCAVFASHCRFDNNAVFNTQFAESDVSGDYFHPSVAGQAKLAWVSWSAGYTWTAVATSITLTTSAPIPPGAQNPVILWGQGFTLSVQFGMPNGGGKSFQLEGTRDGVTWTTITTLTTNPNGRASLFYTPVTNLYYRAVFAVTGDLAAANSNQVRTVVRQLAILRPTNSGSIRSINRNTSITFTTTVRPARPELALAKVSFFFYRYSSGAWQFVTKRDVYIDGAGLARTTFKFTSAGQWYVRSQVNPTPYNANSVMTRVERYSVR